MVTSWRPNALWQHSQFQTLMPFRVREVLLVSSAYDAFVLEEDGSLTDRLFYEYSELSLSWAPRMTHVTSAARALELVEQRRFDLVITVARVEQTDAGQLSHAIRERQAEIPIVLLIFDEADLAIFPHRRAPHAIDRVFQWTGSASLIIAVIKATEDARNVAHDVVDGGVQIIVVAEDNVRAYSSFVGMLYPELLTQSASLIAEGLNDFHRLMRMRARPKILLADNAEAALGILGAFGANICALISDMRIPKSALGAPDGEAGLELAQAMKSVIPELPVLFQTAEANADARVGEMGAWYVDKNAPDFRSQVRRFLQEAVGFGDFVFRLPDRTEVARARDVYEMESALAIVPGASVAYHASRHHFSVWLRARSLFELAKRVRPLMLSDFNDVESLRRGLIATLEEARLREQEGVITDLSSRSTGPENRFVRVGRGSIGGKGRGIAFISTLIVRHSLLHRFEGLEVRIPKTVVLGTDAFDAFMKQFDVNELLALESDALVTERILGGTFPESVQRDLDKAFRRLRGPLAVRSSSLLEDSRFQAFAGVYATYMLPNVDADRDFCFHELRRAIKAVYASAFWKDARSYLAGTPHDAEDQKMAVVIQQVVGQAHGRRFYPPASGVAQSHNIYPAGGQRAADGVAHIALGLGHTVVGGGVALRFSPGAPTMLPQFATAEAFVRGAQHKFYALDLEQSGIGMANPNASLMECDIAVAEDDGVLPLVGSVYCAGDDMIRENLSLPGPRVVTFNNILKWSSVPLADALSRLLAVLREGMGEEVEIEFTVDIPTAGSGPERAARLYLLQVRPMTLHQRRDAAKDLHAIADERLLCRTDMSLGDGSYDDIYDIVHVSAAQLDGERSRELARVVRQINGELRARGRRYLLVGPGRWGSSDPTLGIGVTWADIDHAAVIVETPIGERRVEPSQGTHFFRNITAARVGYLSVAELEGSWLDRAWLDNLTSAGDVAVGASGAVRHITLERPVVAHLDGRLGGAVIEKPEGS